MVHMSESGGRTNGLNFENNGGGWSFLFPVGDFIHMNEGGWCISPIHSHVRQHSLFREGITTA